MGVVEAEFVAAHEDNEVPDGGGEGGEVGGALDAPPHHEWVDREGEQASHHSAVEGHTHHSLLVLLPIHLYIQYKRKTNTHVS